MLQVRELQHVQGASFPHALRSTEIRKPCSRQIKVNALEAKKVGGRKRLACSYWTYLQRLEYFKCSLGTCQVLPHNAAK